MGYINCSYTLCRESSWSSRSAGMVLRLDVNCPPPKKYSGHVSKASLKTFVWHTRYQFIQNEVANKVMPTTRIEVPSGVRVTPLWYCEMGGVSRLWLCIVHRESLWFSRSAGDQRGAGSDAWEELQTGASSTGQSLRELYTTQIKYSNITAFSIPSTFQIPALTYQNSRTMSPWRYPCVMQ